MSDFNLQLNLPPSWLSNPIPLRWAAPPVQSQDSERCSAFIHELQRRRETTYDAQVSRATDEERRAPKRAVHLTLVSFAVTRKAYEVITERFAREYEEQTGVPVRFRLSFGGSGTQVMERSVRVMNIG